MRIFAIAIVIFVVYQSVIWTGLVEPGQGRDNYEMNVITAERWRYKTVLPKVVLVGSSKTNFFNYDVLGKDVEHFGFGGQGCLTGLEILNGSQELPQLILVETGDTLQWPEDRDCVRVVTDKFRVADVLSSLQHRYQPCALMLSVFGKISPRQTPEAATRDQLIQIQRQQLAIPLRTEKRKVIELNVRRAQQLIEALRNRGADVVLFDAPVENEIAQSRYVTETRSFVNSLLDPAHYRCLTNPMGPWHTRDGTHFDSESGKLYSLWLREQIDAFLKEHNSKVSR